MKAVKGKSIMWSIAVISVLFFQLVIMASDNATANIAGDENQLPQHEEMIDLKSIVVDSKSGVSGAGRTVAIDYLFCEVNEGLEAYKIGQHRHTPEMEQEITAIAGEEVIISFTPHLIPISRGILSTIYAKARTDFSTSDLIEIYTDFYREERFVRICPEGKFPNVSFVKGTNFCDIGIQFDPRTRRIVVISVIDNLVKGASGQAVQNMNIMCGFPEDSGIDALSLFP